ncbi:MAG: choice-of-anchor D domain-containing protein [Planctomycetes bacterium]|nr:choice-of-anchor D domain-containing protein [Planctomycetota bacterium]
MNRIAAILTIAVLGTVCGAALTAQTLMPLPAQTGTFSGSVRGYWFTAPSDFTITGLRVPTDASTAAQSIEVVSFGTTPPPLWSSTTNSFTSLYRVVNDATTNILTVNISVTSGEIIGILGARGDVNSYASGAPHTSTINGQSVTLARLGMQFPISTTPAQDIFTESTGSISRVEMYYSVAGDPEIDIQRPAATSIDSGTTDNLGNTLTGATDQYTYTIENLGTTNPLNLTGATVVAINNETNCSATVTTGPSTSIAAQGTTTFVVDVTSSGGGAYSFEISIANDDTTGGEDPYIINVAGFAGSTQEIEILSPTTSSISSGDTLTVYAAQVGVSSTGTFTINNLGVLDLTFSGTPIVDKGTSEVNCTVGITQPTSPIAGLGNDVFDLDIQPSAATFSFTLTILNNDADEGSFVINFVGEAKATVAEPEIAVWDPNNADVANNGTFSETNTGTMSFNRAFTVRNEGGAALNLNGTSIIAVSGESNCSVVVTDPANSLAAATTWLATTDTFSFAITPTAAGAFSFTVTIANNDTDEAPFVFTYSGHTTVPSTTTSGGGGGGGGGGCVATSNGHYSWLVLLSLLSAFVVFTRVRGSKA